MPRTMSATSAILVLTGLMVSLWLLLTVELALGQVNVVTVVMTVSFTVLIALWPFLNGMRVTQQGAQQLVLCFECRQFIPPHHTYGFCTHCGAKYTAAAKPLGAGTA